MILIAVSRIRMCPDGRRNQRWGGMMAYSGSSIESHFMTVCLVTPSLSANSPVESGLGRLG